MADVGRSGPDDVGGGGDVDVGRVASVDQVPATVQNDRLVDVRHRIQVAVLAHRAADGQDVALPVQQAELEPPFVGVVGSAGEGVPHALVADDHVHGDPLAGEKHRRGPIDGHRGLPRARRPEREDVHAQLLIPQEGLDPSDRLLVPPDERKRRVHGEEAVRAHHAALGGHVPPGCRLERHMAVLADAPRLRQVEGSRGVQGHAAVVPVVELVLPPEPAVVVDRLGQADLVARGTELGLAEEGLQQLPLVHRGLRLERGIVQARSPRSRFRACEQVGILLLVGNVIVPVAGPVVNVVDGVARQAGEAGLRLHAGTVDLPVHLAREHQRRIVTSAAPLALHPPHSVRRDREPSHVRLH